MIHCYVSIVLLTQTDLLDSFPHLCTNICRSLRLYKCIPFHPETQEGQSPIITSRCPDLCVDCDLVH